MVSVIIPSYNRASTIKRAAESVLNQTYSDLELIIVDDGSTDNTKEVVESIHDNRLHYIYQDNAGACVARNNGIAYARGEWIAFQDSDDEWLPVKIEKQLNALYTFDADVCICQVRKHYVDKSAPLKIWPNILATKTLTRNEVIKRPVTTTQTIIAKKEVFEDIKFDPLVKKGQDYDWSIRASENYQFVFLKEALVEQYFQNDSITMGGLEKAIEMRKHFISKYPTEIKNYPDFYINQLKTIAFYSTLLGNKEACRYWKECFKADKSIETLFKYLCSKTSVLKKYYKLRNIDADYMP